MVTCQYRDDPTPPCCLKEERDACAGLTVTRLIEQVAVTSHILRLMLRNRTTEEVDEISHLS
jgi:hypothetical protein